MGKKEPSTPSGSLTPTAEAVRAIESLETRLGQVEANQEEMNTLRRMNEELNRRLAEVTMQ
eukprot:5307442-Prorocentrum_lima.AAC.1